MRLHTHANSRLRFATFAAPSRRTGAAAAWVFLLCLFASASAQGTHRRTAKASKKADADTVPVLMLSDIHFEPFQDPAKLRQLRETPVEQWTSILGAPASATQEADFQALQKTCPVRGVDSSWPLLSRSLAQAAAQAPQPLFVTVSGDFLAHAFECRFRALAPGASEEDLSAFASKTIAFVAAQLRLAFPRSQMYLALGNNDSGCGDYREDRNSPFLQHVAESFAGAAGSGENGQTILREFSDEGDYNVALPAPMRAARLIVLQDLFDSAHYKACNGKPVAAAETAQLAWLSTQLQEARAHRQHVWVMAHVPPGVDMYSTLIQLRNVCTGTAPAMFLESEKMADVLVSYTDVISLAVFAHSHADELRFLHISGAGSGAASRIPVSGIPVSGIPVKLVSSISPVNGNRSTFTVAQVDPHTATLLDYTVYFAGDATAASREYSFRETYKLPAFSAASLQSLTAGFLADTAGSSPASQAYQHLFFPGDNGIHAAAMQLFWRSYACSLRENNPDAFRACACSVTSQPAK